MEILTSSALRKAEALTAERYGIPAYELMQNAAFALCEVCAERVPRKSKILILAGRGNNGGDGLAAAKIFLSNGYSVSVALLSDNTPLAELAAFHKEGLAPIEISSKEQLTLIRFNEYDAIIDALLGIGANRPAEGVLAEMIKSANASPALKLSADIPSGLMADTPGTEGEIFRADITVTFSRPKLSFYLAPSKAFCGEVIVKDVGIPDELLSSPLCLLTAENTPLPPPRTPFGYKNLYGHAVLAGGSSGKSGAIILASSAALRAGAGLVTCALPKSLVWALSAHPELMSIDGDTDNYFSAGDAKKILNFLKPNMTLAAGPGLGRGEETAAFVRALIKNRDMPMVLDADALYALNDETLSELAGRGVLTPHAGEFFTLAGRSFGDMDRDEFIKNRLKISGEYAVKHKIFLVLKGAETIISTPDGRQFISVWGDSALSKGGSGDILTGIITALIAQGIKIEDALKTACKMQGDAARAASANRSAYSVNPMDIVDAIGII
ncbi:MAG: NAD(P)H-hydrate dehydratase [Deferribacteraceae bacterium]|jgi:NAD(P)H-hydrate epimerase|nr:NAD(P)H-hydrate dehydratase [Deferribacteraceae bacterium]